MSAAIPLTPVEPITNRVKNALNYWADLTTQYDILNYAVGSVMAIAITDFIRAATTDMISPIFLSMLGPNWKDHTMTLGSITFQTGDFFNTILQVGFMVLILYVLIESLFKYDLKAKEERQRQLKLDRERDRVYQEKVVQSLETISKNTLPLRT